MAVSVASTLDQLAIFIHRTCEAIMPLKKNLAEYGHFQGSWSVPRRSGSQVKFWLKVDNDKLDPMQFSGKLVKDVEQVKENELGKQLKFRNIFLFLWDCLSRNYEGFPRRHVPSLASRNLSQAFGCVAGTCSIFQFSNSDRAGWPCNCQSSSTLIC